MPILANTLIEAEGDKVFISATDLDVGIRGAYGATVAGKGSITVSARKLYEITRELPEDETITFRTEENDWVGIKLREDRSTSWSDSRRRNTRACPRARRKTSPRSRQRRFST